MNECKSLNVPINKAVIDNVHIENANESSEVLYREIVGSIMFIVIESRLDIAFAAGFVSRFLLNYKGMLGCSKENSALFVKYEKFRYNVSKRHL